MHLKHPVVHSVDPAAGAVTTMEHHVLYVQGTDKYATTTEIASPDCRAIMFLDTKHAVDKLTDHLLHSGSGAAALHWPASPSRSAPAPWTGSNNGHVTVLVATNVAARGIHVDTLDLVVNVDPLTDHKDYTLHRGGRTARAAVCSVVTLGAAEPAPGDDPADGGRRDHPAGDPGAVAPARPSSAGSRVRRRPPASRSSRSPR
ncbi:ATP-dependent RNA helicase RhlB [Streptomyces badius]